MADIVIAGALAQKPWIAGHTWVYLQYILGFRRLGLDVLFLDRLDPTMSIDERGQPCEPAASVNLRYAAAVAREFGFEDAFAVLGSTPDDVFGLSRAQVIEHVGRSRLLLNIMGYLQDPAILDKARRRVFLDIDPGVGQMWRELGQADVFRGHDRYVTIGEHIGRGRDGIPGCGLPWITTRQPVVLDQWPRMRGAGAAFTTVATWRGTYAPIAYQGRVYGQRVHEFRRFASLPRLTRSTFALALDIDDTETRDIAMLNENGWALVPPKAVAPTPASYRRFIQASRAEFMVAKNLVVETRSGWFSDRSICYLASGRPVVAQDTGLADLYPVGEGLLTYSTLDEAVDAVTAVDGDYARHADAARGLAEQFFDSDTVLTRLLDRLEAA